VIGGSRVSNPAVSQTIGYPESHIDEKIISVTISIQTFTATVFDRTI
jgi:hypothetical protein